MPVSITEKAITLRARRSVELSSVRRSGSTSRTRRTLPWSVNLKALASRFLSTCWSRCGSVRMYAGERGESSIW